MALFPPDDPYLIYTVIFGFPLVVRWYGVLIMSGAVVAAYLAGRRALARGIDPEHAWNQLMLGLVISIICARIYYVAFQWELFAPNPITVLYINNGGIAIHGAIIGALLSGVIYTRWNRLSFFEWADICMPTFIIAQAIGRWGNFFNQEAYGQPTTLGFGVRIAPEYRVDPYRDLTRYPPDTLFHATFLYESIWDFAGAGLLFWLDKRFGKLAPAPRWRLRDGDLLFLYALIYSLGRVWIEGLRVDSLCTGSVGGNCAGTFRTAQLVSVALIVIGIAGLIWNHTRKDIGVKATEELATEG